MWSLVVRVLRLWYVPNSAKPNLPSSLELVLMDQKGDKIHASIGKTHVYIFKNRLKEGGVYLVSNLLVELDSGHYRTTRHQHKLAFQIDSRVKPVSDEAVPDNILTFDSPADVFSDNYDNDFLVDVMGMLTAVGVERTFERNGAITKLNIIELDNDGYRFKCTLFGSYVDQLNSFISSGDAENVVVVILFAKITVFHGKTTLQSTLQSTKLMFNPTFCAAKELRKRMVGNSVSPSCGISQLQESVRTTVEQDFLELTPSTTIIGLRDSKDPSNVVLGTIKHYLGDDEWWYRGCVCNKKLIEDSGMYFCEKCNKHVVSYTPRYLLKFEVGDDTGRAIFVIFDNESEPLLNKTCSEMIRAANQDATIPLEILNLVDKIFLFKLEVRSANGGRFQRSYRVKRLCDDLDVIHKFKELNLPKDADGGDSNLNGSTVSPTIGVSTEAIAQDLLPKFSSTDVSNGSGASYIPDEINGSAVMGSDTIDLGDDSDEPSKLKRATPADASGSSSLHATKLLKRDIKIEKD